MLKPLTKVEVTWVDSNGLAGWHHLDTMEHELTASYRCTSVGYVVADRPAGLTLVMSLSSERGAMDGLSIPRCAITKIKSLR